MVDTTLNLSKINLSDFTPDADGEVAGLPPSQRTLPATIKEASKVNPQQHSKNLKLSEQAGIPVESVAGNPEQVEQKLKFDQIDLDGMSQRSPNTAEFYTDFNNAVVAQNDMSVLERLEHVFKGSGESIGLGFELQGQGILLGATDSTSEDIRSLVPSSMLPSFMTAGEAAAFSQSVAQTMGINTNEELKLAKEKSVNMIIEEIQSIQKKRGELTPEDLTIVEEGARSAFESLVNQSPGFAVMLATGSAVPMLSLMGAQTGSGSFAEARADGLDPETATLKAGIDSAIEIATEIIPAKTMERVLGGAATGDFKKELFRFIMSDVAGENVATAGQTLNDVAFGLDEQLNSDLPIEEKIQIQLRRQAVTTVSAILAGGAQIGTVAVVRKTADKIAERQTVIEVEQEAEQQKIDQLGSDCPGSGVKAKQS